MTKKKKDEPPDSTALLNELRRTTRKIFDRGASEELGLNLAVTFDQLDGHLESGGALPGQWRRRRGRPRMEEEGEIRDDVVHGTRAGYAAGCGCLRCRAANREYVAEWRRNQKEQVL
jgi:hypothetical protein